jgi:hypothetical protein
VVAAALTSALMLAMMTAPALAFHHKSVPADECAPPQAGEPGNNPHAVAAIKQRNPVQSLPLPPAGTSSQAPLECPAPNK